MPVRNFDVETYTVLTTQSGATPSGAWRLLTLTSTALAHGIRTRASVFFFESGPSTLGVVSNVDQPNFNGQNIAAYCRKADFADWYDLLRNEQPLKLTYAYAGAEFDPNQPNRELWWLQLHTGQQEPPGEGPEEMHALLFPAEVRNRLQKAPSPE